MIPKKIHYCWFGRNPLPGSAQKCIASWRRYLPDYEIIEWNEDNFDIDSIPYIRQAYETKKYAFVSDYARFKILYEHGGLYFDTDVEVIRPMDMIVSRGPFMGFEIDAGGDREFGAVAPGLCLGAEVGMPLYKSILDYYTVLNFVLPDGSYNITDAVVNITTRELVKAGLEDRPGIQNAGGVTVYPAEYFNPFDDATGRLRKTVNTYTIHWYSKTWLNVSPARQWLGRMAHRVLGVNFLSRILKKIR